MSMILLRKSVDELCEQSARVGWGRWGRERQHARGTVFCALKVRGVVRNTTFDVCRNRLIGEDKRCWGKYFCPFILRFAAIVYPKNSNNWTSHKAVNLRCVLRSGLMSQLIWVSLFLGS